MNNQDIQSAVATAIALKQLYDMFQPKEEVKKTEELPAPKEIKQEYQDIKETRKQDELRKKAYIGLNGLSLNNTLEQ